MATLTSGQVQLVSSCDPNTVSCLIQIPDRRHYVAYAKFKDLASGQEFWFVSGHLTLGSIIDTLMTPAHARRGPLQKKSGPASHGPRTTT